MVSQVNTGDNVPVVGQRLRPRQRALLQAEVVAARTARLQQLGSIVNEQPVQKEKQDFIITPVYRNNFAPVNNPAFA